MIYFLTLPMLIPSGPPAWTLLRRRPISFAIVLRFRRVVKRASFQKAQSDSESSCTRRRNIENAGYSTLSIGARIVATIEGDVLWKSVKPNGFLIRPPAIAWAVKAIDEAEHGGVQRLEARANGKTYWLTLTDFPRYAFPIQRGGFEPQLAVVLDRWHVQRPGEHVWVQPSLFSGAEVAA